jgi:hypothetical protein
MAKYPGFYVVQTRKQKFEVSPVVHATQSMHNPAYRNQGLVGTRHYWWVDENWRHQSLSDEGH